jgi:hypothetical protein
MTRPEGTGIESDGDRSSVADGEVLTLDLLGSLLLMRWMDEQQTSAKKVNSHLLKGCRRAEGRADLARVHVRLCAVDVPQTSLPAVVVFTREVLKGGSDG